MIIKNKYLHLLINGIFDCLSYAQILTKIDAKKQTIAFESEKMTNWRQFFGPDIEHLNIW